MLYLHLGACSNADPAVMSHAEGDGEIGGALSESSEVQQANSGLADQHEKTQSAYGPNYDRQYRAAHDSMQMFLGGSRQGALLSTVMLATAPFWPEDIRGAVIGKTAIVLLMLSVFASVVFHLVVAGGWCAVAVKDENGEKSDFDFASWWAAAAVGQLAITFAALLLVVKIFIFD